MAIEVPGKRWGKRLQHSKVFGHGGGHGKKQTYADLLITPLVDMFVIIVLFLIANFSATGEVLMMSRDIQLPEAFNVTDIEIAPVVMVSNTDIMVSGNVIGRVEDLTKDDYLNIPALEEKLREMKKQYEDLHALAKDTEGSFKGDVNIQAHRDVQFKVMKRVLYSCATAGYTNLNFAVLQKGSGAVGEPSTATGSP
ncbi:MAG TPA: biopolymer transporter ExbD [Myxococcales bacterium]|jgi:biopolymer transport protein ExbD|nr:biopolymer transporter ExbD [Myxococcales bacterium]